MRWDRQRVGGAGASGQPVEQALPGLPGLVRSVRAPEFAGVTFHEVRARSVLNKVPGGSAMPFGWTVNPYRGCTHACSYCLAGETPILMTDGRVRPLADLRVGDEIYGTRVFGRHRRYVPTRVLAHWWTLKPAYRVRLSDGTELIASADHRFLTDRGWKYVLGSRWGTGRRAHLTELNRLVGTGTFAAPPEHTEEYRRGYLCGVIRAAAAQESAQGNSAQGNWTQGNSARGNPVPVVAGAGLGVTLALAGAEALDRAQTFLAGFGQDTVRFTAEPAAIGLRPALRTTQEQAHGSPAVTFATLPEQPETGWCKGFLAGAFDAAGRRSITVLRFAAPDPDLSAAVAGALERLGFRYAVETGGRAGDLRALGGLAEHLRLLQTIDPAVTRKRTLEGLALTAPPSLRVADIQPLGAELRMFDITTGTGDFIANGVVSHNCFARGSHSYLDFDTGRDFDTQVVVKVNAPEVLAAQLRKPGWAGDHVAMGTNTDPYQRAEGRYRLMPGIIRALADAGTPFSILTKGTMLARDLPLLSDVASGLPVGVGVSIALLDHELQRRLEPGTPSPRARLDLVRRISDAGLSCGVFVAPVLPGLTDSVEALDRLLAAVAEAGATGVTVLPLHLRPGAREWFARWLGAEHPELVPRYREIFGRGSYASKAYRSWLSARIDPLVRAHGLAPERADTARGVPGMREACWPEGAIPAQRGRSSARAPRDGPNITEDQQGGEQLTLL